MRKIILVGNSTHPDLTNYFEQEISALEKCGLSFFVFINQIALGQFRTKKKFDYTVISKGSNSSGDLKDIFRSLVLVKYIIMHNRHIEEIHFMSVNIKNFLPLIAAYCLVGKVKCTIHDVIPHEGRGVMDKIFNLILIFVSSSLVTYSKYSKNQIRKNYKWFSGKIYVRKLGGYDMMYPLSNSLDSSVRKKEQRVLVFGRMEKYKGIDNALHFAKRLSNVKFDFYGRGNYGKVLKESELQNIYYNNAFISDSKLGDLFNNYSYILLPYTSATQSGVIPLAHHFGLFPIATNVGALPEQISCERYGFVGDIDEIEHFLSNLATHHLDRHSIYSYSKTQTFNECVNVIASEYENILDSI